MRPLHRDTKMKHKKKTKERIWQLITRAVSVRRCVPKEGRRRAIEKQAPKTIERGWLLLLLSGATSALVGFVFLTAAVDVVSADHVV